MLVLATAAVAATVAERRAPQTQVLRHPHLAAEFAAPFGGSRLLLGGTLQNERTALVVVRRDGSLDPHFADDGVLRFDEESGPGFFTEEFGHTVAVDRRGRILFVGHNGGPVRRLLPNGRPDRSFGSGGAVRLRFAGKPSYLISIAARPDGKILVGGEVEGSGGGSPALARLTEGGDPDPGFGDDGSKVLRGTFPGDSPRVVDIALGPKGEVFAVVGNYPLALAIQRLGPRGGISRSFGRRGTLTVGEAGPGNSDIFALPTIAVAPDGKLVVGSKVDIRGGRGSAMVAFRYLANGRPDPSFGRSGYVSLATVGSTDTGAVAVRPDGKIVLVGGGTTKRGLCLLLAGLLDNGDRDPAVGSRGFARAAVVDFSAPSALVLQGKTAVVVGYTTGLDSEVSRAFLTHFRLPQ